MADFTLTEPAVIPPGTTGVGAYLATSVPQSPSGSPPSGAAVSTKTAGTDGSLAFTGLAAGRTYVAYKAGLPMVAFRVPPITPYQLPVVATAPTDSQFAASELSIGLAVFCSADSKIYVRSAANTWIKTAALS